MTFAVPIRPPELISLLRFAVSRAKVDNPSMSDPSPPRSQDRPITPVKTEQPAPRTDKVLCERCGAEMYRMHAVWRCANCGFKTDCCGW
jgi:hypothetical protein